MGYTNTFLAVEGSASRSLGATSELTYCNIYSHILMLYTDLTCLTVKVCIICEDLVISHVSKSDS